MKATNGRQYHQNKRQLKRIVQAAGHRRAMELLGRLPTRPGLLGLALSTIMGLRSMARKAAGRGD